MLSSPRVVFRKESNCSNLDIFIEIINNLLKLLDISYFVEIIVNSAIEKSDQLVVFPSAFVLNFFTVLIEIKRRISFQSVEKYANL